MSLRKLKWRGIGRLELLAWVNEFLETDYTKIEHLADGIAYCQIFDAMYPGKVNLQQLNFQARTEMEYERNLKVLKRTFQLCDIRKEIPIRKLVQGIFQEHFEFLHWIHDYVHRTFPDAVRSYHGFKRRQEVLGQSASQPQISTNTNLIPKYSNSMRLLCDPYIESPTALPLDVDEEATEDLTTEAPAADISAEEHISAAPPEEDLTGMDQSLEFVRYGDR
ncbi:hypothetical protein PHYBOEH_009496 [Phytophthora boehmeriae]|uniref:Calponin-homology (CH) domain-containing protein n=1 Tax=Phytophthora boehmeriae TaxID=109152 RepID=A0A8T1X7W8_9STRA|nr:hypothetical protein PHYBOEH_009496 [Phytophthora boehmeriae]